MKKSKKHKIRKYIREAIRSLNENPEYGWGNYNCNTTGIADIFMELRENQRCIAAAGRPTKGPQGDNNGPYSANNDPFWMGSWEASLDLFQQQCCNVTGGYGPQGSGTIKSQGDNINNYRNSSKMKPWQKAGARSVRPKLSSGAKKR